MGSNKMGILFFAGAACLVLVSSDEDDCMNKMNECTQIVSHVQETMMMAERAGQSLDDGVLDIMFCRGMADVKQCFSDTAKMCMVQTKYLSDSMSQIFDMVPHMCDQDNPCSPSKVMGCIPEHGRHIIQEGEMIDKDLCMRLPDAMNCINTAKIGCKDKFWMRKLDEMEQSFQKINTECKTLYGDNHAIDNACDTTKIQQCINEYLEPKLAEEENFREICKRLPEVNHCYEIATTGCELDRWQIRHIQMLHHERREECRMRFGKNYAYDPACDATKLQQCVDEHLMPEQDIDMNFKEICEGLPDAMNCINSAKTDCKGYSIQNHIPKVQMEYDRREEQCKARHIVNNIHEKPAEAVLQAGGPRCIPEERLMPKYATPGYTRLVHVSSFDEPRNCEIKFVAKDENDGVDISILKTDMPTRDSYGECGSDNITFYDGETTSSPVLATVCGNEIQTLESSGHAILMVIQIGRIPDNTIVRDPFDTYRGVMLAYRGIDREGNDGHSDKGEGNDEHSDKGEENDDNSDKDRDVESDGNLRLHDSDSDTTSLSTVPVPLIVGVGLTVIVVAMVIFASICIFFCRRKKKSAYPTPGFGEPLLFKNPSDFQSKAPPPSYIDVVEVSNGKPHLSF